MTRLQQLSLAIASLIVATMIGQSLVWLMPIRIPARTSANSIQLTTNSQQSATEQAVARVANANAQAMGQSQTGIAIDAAQAREVGDFSLSDELGQERNFSDLRAGAPAFVYFYAGGCVHCNSTLLDFKNGGVMSRVREKGFRLIGIEFYGTPEHGREMRQKYSLPSPILADRKAEICGRYGVGEFTVFLVGMDGKLYYRNMIANSNWPNDEMLDRVLAFGGRPTNQQQQAINQEQQGATIYADPVGQMPRTGKKSGLFYSAPILQHDFTNSILAGQVKGQDYYYVLFPVILLLIPFAIALKLRCEQGSWSHWLAIGQLLLVATFLDIWLQSGVNLAMALILILLLTRKQWVMGFAVSIGAILFLKIFFDYGKLGETNSHQVTTFLYLMPHFIGAIVLYRLAFMTQKAVYEKAVYPGAGGFEAPAHEGALAIRGVTRPERCDICHQVDQFNQETGYCTRCQRRTA